MKLNWIGTILIHFFVFSFMTYGQHYEGKCGTWRWATVEEPELDQRVKQK